MSQLISLIAALLVGAAAFTSLYWGLATMQRFAGGELASSSTTPASGGGVQRLLIALSLRVAPHLPPKLARDLELRIVRAGGLAGMTPARIVINALSASLAGLALGVLFVVATGATVSWAVVLFTLGAALPFLWLRDQVQERHLAILTDLPFHLDLLTLCVEAGLDFSAGVIKMVEKGRPGPLREEFNRFLAEIRLGKTRAEALESMGERVGLQELSGFLSALIQAERLGSGLAKTLRAQSEQLRIERFQRAETKAGEAPVKMLLPLVLFVFPTIWIILAAPLVFEWVWK